MEQAAFIEKVDGKLADVLVYRTSACGEGCGSNCMMCGTAKPIRLTAKNEADAKPGDRVMIASNTGLVLRLSFFTYIIPIITMVAGYGIAAAFGLAERPAALGAAIGLLLGFIPSVLINRGIKRKNFVTYTVTKVLEK